MLLTMKEIFGKSVDNHYALKCLKWFSCEEEAYKYNMQHRREEMCANGWDKREVTYSFNKYSFRSDSFSLKDGIMFLGCSYTFGMALEEEHTWARLVANHFGKANWNLGIAGGSNDSAFRLGYYWIPKLLPKAVVLLSPEIARKEIINVNSGGVEFKRLGMWNVVKDPNADMPILPKHDTYIDYVLTEENGELNQIKNILGLETICAQHNIPFVVKDFVEDIRPVWTSEVRKDAARDLSHIGITGNRKIADLFINELEKVL